MKAQGQPAEKDEQQYARNIPPPIDPEEEQELEELRCKL
jgi:hypothetical protein